MMNHLDAVMDAEVMDEPASRAALSEPGAVELDGVVFGYRTGERVLDGVSLRVPARSMCAIVGPSGSGKTTIARLLADRTGLVFEQVSATFSGVTDLRRVFAAAARRRRIGRGTLLFVDEIHRFNRAQQDSFLPYVEDGTVVLVGATTENPSFELNGALLSRCQVMVLRRLDEAALGELLARTKSLTGRSLSLTEEARTVLLAMADGDGRYLLGMVEQILAAQNAGGCLPGGPGPLGVEGLRAVVASRVPLYDKSREEHYNLISALHKSMRGSDPDAALYWLARMLVGGEDPRYVARRLVRFASEDVGMADPAALQMTLAAWDAGSPWRAARAGCAGTAGECPGRQSEWRLS